jgi:hypothetical protein
MVASAWVVYERIRIITFVVVVISKIWGSSVHHIMLTKHFFESTKGCLTRG